MPANRLGGLPAATPPYLLINLVEGKQLINGLLVAQIQLFSTHRDQLIALIFLQFLHDA